MAMVTENSSGYKTFEATAVAIEAYVRVTVGATGTISVAGETDLAVGVTMEAIAASGYGTVKLWSASGSFLVQAAGVVAIGNQLYAAAAGEVDDSGTYKTRLVALTAATAQGDVIECTKVEDATYNGGQMASADVGALTATGTVIGNAAAITKLVSFSTGDDAVGVKLPEAAAGMVRFVYNLAATAGLKVYPSANDDINDGTANAAVVIEGKSLAMFVALDTATWAAQYTANS
jgi:hypothetical protein